MLLRLAVLAAVCLLLSQGALLPACHDTTGTNGQFHITNGRYRHDSTIHITNGRYRHDSTTGQAVNTTAQGVFPRDDTSVEASPRSLLTYYFDIFNPEIVAVKVSAGRPGRTSVTIRLQDAATSVSPFMPVMQPSADGMVHEVVDTWAALKNYALMFQRVADINNINQAANASSPFQLFPLPGVAVKAASTVAASHLDARDVGRLIDAAEAQGRRDAWTETSPGSVLLLPSGQPFGAVADVMHIAHEADGGAITLDLDVVHAPHITSEFAPHGKQSLLDEESHYHLALPDDGGVRLDAGALLAALRAPGATLAGLHVFVKGGGPCGSYVGVGQACDGIADGATCCTYGSCPTTAPRVCPDSWTLTLTAKASITFGESVTLTATLRNGGTATSGKSVVFTDSVSGYLCTSTTDANGDASCTYIPSAAGSPTITAVATGLATATATVTVNPASSTTSLAPLPAPSVPIGNPVTLAATVTAQTGALCGAMTVTFFDGGTTLGFAQTDINGVARLSYTPTRLGSHTVTAQAAGNTNCLGSTSSAVTFTVVAPSLQLKALTGPTLALGSTGTLQVRVTQSDGSAYPGVTVNYEVATTIPIDRLTYTTIRGAQRERGAARAPAITASGNTDTNGVSTFSLTSTAAGSADVGVASVEVGGQTIPYTGQSLTFTWRTPGAASITLTPRWAHRHVGERARFEVLVKDAGGDPVVDALVVFALRGACEPESVAARTNANGLATVSAGNGQPGHIAVVAATRGASGALLTAVGHVEFIGHGGDGHEDEDEGDDDDMRGRPHSFREGRYEDHEALAAAATKAALKSMNEEEGKAGTTSSSSEEL